MLLPIVLILCGTSAALAFACGTNPDLARHAHGLQIIMLARRVQWPMVAASLAFSIALLALVISGKKRACWLIGLAPILLLFVHRFAPAARAFGVLDSPVFVEARSPAAPRDDEWVVGVVFEKQPYAFPYRALYASPMVLVTDYDKRLLLLWSAQANRATATVVGHDFRPRELEIVSRPADALLILNRRYGQYISSITGRTIDDRRPIGFVAPVAVEKTTWLAWRGAYPETRVMAIPEIAGDAPSAPSRASFGQRRQPVALIATTQPVAIPSAQKLDEPLNLVVGRLRVLVVRDPRTGTLRAFERRVADDLFPTFRAEHDRRKPDAALVDSDTRSLWTIDGRAVEGALKGEWLREIAMEDRLDWDVMKYWYPSLAWIDVTGNR